MIPVGFIIGVVIGYKLNKVKKHIEYVLQLVCVVLASISWWGIIIRMLPILAYRKPELLLAPWFSPVVQVLFAIPPAMLLGFVFGGMLCFDIKRRKEGKL